MAGGQCPGDEAAPIETEEPLTMRSGPDSAIGPWASGIAHRPPASELAPVVCAGVVVADHLCTPIDRLPDAGELVMADDLILNLGGCASNAAVDLARLGVRAA